MQVDNKHMKRCSTLVIIREMQIENTMRYHLTQVKMSIIKKATNNKHMKRCSTLVIIREMQIENTMRYHLTQVKCPSSKKLQTINAGEHVDKKEPSCTVGANANGFNHYGVQYGDFLKKKKTRNKTTN